MTARPVHWEEGMFLRPHHFQASHRHIADVTQTGLKWDLHYNWGLRSVEIDLDALGNHRLVIRSLRARLRDGSLIRVPEDGQLPALDLRPAFQESATLTAYLAVPVLRLGKANVARDGQSEAGRYRVESQEIEDENSGLSPQRVETRLLNLRLLLSGQEQAGLEVLELVRAKKSTEADNRPQMDREYIPPLLACDAWEPLKAGIIQSVYDRIGQKIDILANQVQTRGISIDGYGQDAIIIGQLRQLNEGYALLGVLTFAEGVHPLAAYLELCRLAGQLSIFGDTCRPPPLPPYDHDDLGGCFYKVKFHLDRLLNRIVEPEYKQIPFIGQGLRLHVTLEPAWLEAAWEMFVGVKSPLAAEECVTLVTDATQLDMKIGSGDRVDEIYRGGARSLRFVYTPHPPRALPRVPNLIYFQIDRASEQNEWQNVARSLILGLRFKEDRVGGNLDGQRVIKARMRNQTTALELTLYIIRSDPRGAPTRP